MNHHKHHHITKRGFTLVEILVAITILSIIGGATIISLNPRKQVSKAYDTVRQQDLSTIRTALDTYYHDHNKYPTTLPFGEEFNDDTNGTVYLPKVPQDPEALSTGYSYVYIPETSANPQWYVLYSKLSETPAKGSACPISAQSNCAPAGADESWACTYGGEIQCNSIVSYSVGPTITPSITSTPTMTPTPTSSSSTYTITMTESPNFTQATVSPTFPNGSTPQQFTVDVVDSSDVTEVTATVQTGIGTTSYPLTLQSGTAQNGTWGGSWVLSDPGGRFAITIEGTDSAGNSSSVTITLR